MFKNLLLFLVIFSFVFSDEWHLCDSSDDYELTVTSVNITPDPPHVGDSVTASIDGSLSKVINGGTVKILIKYNGITILNTSAPLCSDPDDFECPHPSGKFRIKKTIQIPEFTPAGKYSGIISINDNNSKKVTCVDFDIPVVN
ncbi:phosphatidylglycerol/phosphatidylinositol transfer protein [Anaeramoeba flamelloides]|uniref:Phosphatidylglycerol/phosphatidylinositol transfer protein n=1 Tax=Anaeramoeba flamelloides TaxID=1746091 RepID=A0AAV7Z5V3_9EUKA|nr:phosphatidylglycerol/phosphatidylinositol transfer protein [Anaeramoeba flamelloides]KAJ6226051.1 phosphatidylglycerol/phosphatidylinositol transfer protein [Anaeramoeba flamelloides]|eukprot:Anaeramoba_flamelloidesa580275_522.p1 GENE.a580275_522~~a580275_522.p1  ORF type:complete len:143 (+),score=27.83 a580275_522:74-502(+)